MLKPLFSQIVYMKRTHVVKRSLKLKIMENYISKLKSLIDISVNLEKNDFLNTIEDEIVSLYDTNRFVIDSNNENDKIRILGGLHTLINEQEIPLEEITRYLLIFPKQELISFLYFILKNAKTNYDH
jgi:hypothetical protein